MALQNCLQVHTRHVRQYLYLCKYISKLINHYKVLSMSVSHGHCTIVVAMVAVIVLGGVT